MTLGESASSWESSSMQAANTNPRGTGGSRRVSARPKTARPSSCTPEKRTRAMTAQDHDVWRDPGPSLHVPTRTANRQRRPWLLTILAATNRMPTQVFRLHVGRVCNRIAKKQVHAGGKDYSSAITTKPDHLHGGIKRSFDKVVWKARMFRTASSEADSLELRSPAGEEGYPGKLKVESDVLSLVHQQLRSTSLSGRRTDAATPVNLTNHSYFNLAGAVADTSSTDELFVNADQYTPVDDTLIHGEDHAVKDTPLDFTKMTRLGARIDEAHAKRPPSLRTHNLVLNKRAALADEAARLARAEIRPASWRSSPRSPASRSTAHFLKGKKGKERQDLRPTAAPSAWRRNTSPTRSTSRHFHRLSWSRARNPAHDRLRFLDRKSNIPPLKPQV